MRVCVCGESIDYLLNKEGVRYVYILITYWNIDIYKNEKRIQPVFKLRWRYAAILSNAK